MEKEDKRGIFFGVIGVLTLIVAIIGASFAYFTINASSNKNAVTVNAATVKIVYSEGDKIAMDGLIPASRDDAIQALQRGLKGDTYKVNEADIPYTPCKDDNNYTVCGYYEFSLKNDGDNPVELKAYITPEQLAAAVVDEENPENNKPAEIGFRNLNYILFDRTAINGTTPIDLANNGTEVYAGVVPFDADNNLYDVNGFGILGEDINKTLSIAGKGTETKKYRLFIWLNDTNDNSNDLEQGATFKGTIHVDLPGTEGKIHGVVE